MDRHNYLAPCQCRPVLQNGRWGLRTCKLTHSTPKLNPNMPWSTLTWRLDKGSCRRTQPCCHFRRSKCHPHDKQKNSLARRWEAGRLSPLCMQKTLNCRTSFPRGGWSRCCLSLFPGRTKRDCAEPRRAKNVRLVVTWTWTLGGMQPFPLVRSLAYHAHLS
jgi:hypothetical protein